MSQESRFFSLKRDFRKSILVPTGQRPNYNPVKTDQPSGIYTKLWKYYVFLCSHDRRRGFVQLCSALALVQEKCSHFISVVLTCTKIISEVYPLSPVNFSQEIDKCQWLRNFLSILFKSYWLQRRKWHLIVWRSTVKHKTIYGFLGWLYV